MKRKLLTVLLAVVMVFGVFGLTACGGSNPDEDYNYYASKYAIEDEIKIDAVTYQAVYRMFTGGGKYLLYIDSEDAGAADRFKSINKLANDWDVTIYHFNPDLSGGFAKSTDPTANLLADFTKEENKLAAKSEIVKLQDTLNTITAGGWKSVKDHQLLGINASAYATEVDYADAYAGRQSVMDAQQAMEDKAIALDTAIATEETRVAAAEAVVEAAKAALAAAKAADPVVPADVAAAEEALEEAEADLATEKGAVDAAKAAFNKAMADITKAEDALAAASVNVYYGSKGYSGWVSPITARDYNKGEEAIAAISVKQPSYGKYTSEEKDVPYIPEAYNTSAINTMNLFGDARLHMYDDQDAFNAEKEDVFVTLANYGMFAHLMDNNEGYFAVFFGGTWCPNTQAIVYHVNKLAKDYGISKVYFFDPKLDDGTKIDTHKVVENEDGTYSVATTVYGANLASNMNTRTGDTQTAGKTTPSTADDKYQYSNCYNFLYARFLDNYLDTYWSEWNITSKLVIGASNADGKEYAYTDAAIHTRMCVPNMMMFNGEGEGKAKLVGLCEAEYTWANTSVEGSAENVNWIEAVKSVFDTNPYADYAPVMVVEEAAADSSAPAAAAPAAGAADAGGC